MSIASVLIASDRPDELASSSFAGPRYSLLLSTDPSLIEAAQRLRYDVFTSTPGFALPAAAGIDRDVDRFDEFCDHLLVRDDDTGELVGCYRMLAPTGAIAAGGLYTATEFDVSAFDSLRPSLVEMGRAVVRDGHRNGGVVLLMWAGILAYLDRYGYDYVTGCVSVPIGGAGDGEANDEAPGSQLRGVRDFILSRHAAPPQYRVHPKRPVILDGKGLDDILPPSRPSVPPLMRGYLRLGTKRQADIRYLKRLRSVSAASKMAGATVGVLGGGAQ
jgi:putative hemolysin